MGTKAYYEAHKAAGLCVYCSNLPEPGVIVCKYHLERRRMRDRKEEAERKKLELCRECGKPRPSRVTFCDDCREKHNKNSKNLRESWEATGRCITCGAEHDSKYKRCTKCRASMATAVSQNRTTIKKTLMDHYGNICACCGETNPLFLTLDHMNNDGAKHRKLLSNSTEIYRWLIKENYPEGYQVLCFNCNCGRARNGGVCPHISSK